jgi:hypothetical protein
MGGYYKPHQSKYLLYFVGLNEVLIKALRNL